MATIHGNDSPNSIIGTAGDDLIFGHDGDDTISGGAGNDRILGGLGVDSLSGGAGDDIFEIRSGSELDFLEAFNGGSGVDTLRLSSVGSVAGSGVLQFNFEITTISSIERLEFVSSRNDIDVSFNLIAPFPVQFSQNLEFVGGARADTANFILGDNTSLNLRGATFTNWGVNDKLKITANGRNSTISATQVSDEIWIELSSFQKISGNDGDDQFIVNDLAMSNTIDGGSGYDVVTLQGDGWLTNASNFLLRIEEVRFEFAGSLPTEEHLVELPTINFDMPGANQQLHFVDNDSSISRILFATSSSDTHFDASKFTFENWQSNDIVEIFGRTTNQRLVGSVVADKIGGIGGNDTIFGMGGDDSIYSGQGAEIFSGGVGIDSFLFGVGTSGVGLGNQDRILDFTTGDLIDLSSIDANSILAGDQAFVLDTDGNISEGEIGFKGNLNTVIQINLDADADIDMEIVLRGVSPVSLSELSFNL